MLAMVAVSTAGEGSSMEESRAVAVASLMAIAMIAVSGVSIARVAMSTMSIA